MNQHEIQNDMALKCQSAVLTTTNNDENGLSMLFGR